MNPLRQLFNWWFRQLRDLFSSGFGESGWTAADALIVAPEGPLSHGPQQVVLSARKNRAEQPLGRFTPGELGAAASVQTPAQLTIVRLDESEILEKTVVLPLAAERNLGDVLAMEMDRETPFGAEELYWTYRVAARDRELRRVSVRLAMIPRAKLARLFAALAAAHIQPDRLEVTGRGWSWPVDGAVEHRSRDWSTGLLWPAAIACAALALVTVVILPFARQAAAFAAVDREIAAGRAATAGSEALLTEIAQRFAAAELIERERGKTGRLLEVLAAATRVLPDNSFLTELSLRQRKLTLAGRSTGASRLIGALAADASFRNPAFAAPVTRVEAAGGEGFTITAEVEP